MSRRPVGSIRWRSPGVARVELQAGFDPITGKPRRISETVHGSEGDAERALARMLLDIGKLPSGGNMTLGKYLEDLYIPRMKKQVRRSTATGYEGKLRRHVIPKIGHINLADLNAWTLEGWRDDLLDNMSGQSALHVFRVLSRALTKAVAWHRIQVNPMKSIEAPHANLRDLDTLKADEAVKYLKAFTGHILEPVVTLAVATGLRPCELYGLRWSDIDLKAAEVTVRRGLHERKSESWFEQPKSERSHRTVSLPAWAVETLTQLRGIGPLVAGDGAEGHARPTEIARQYRKQAQAKKLRYVPMRDLRHTHATLMLEAGVDIVVVSRRLGHSNVAITDKHYLRPRRSVDQAAADAFGELLAFRGEKSSVAVDGVKSTAVNEEQ